MNTKKLVASYPVLASSANPEELSLMIKGILVGLVPILILFLAHYGYAVTDTDLMKIINDIFAVVSSVMIIIGMLRKIYYSGK